MLIRPITQLRLDLRLLVREHGRLHHRVTAALDALAQRRPGGIRAFLARRAIGNRQNGDLHPSTFPIRYMSITSHPRAL